MTEWLPFDTDSCKDGEYCLFWICYMLFVGIKVFSCDQAALWMVQSVRLSVQVLYRQLELTKLTHPDLHYVVGLFILRDVRQSLEYPCALRVLRTSPHGFLGSLVIWEYVAWEWWEFRWSNKWNWYSSGINASILVWHTCTSALSGWVLYKQLELTKLTHPDLHHVGLFILRDIRPSVCLSVRHTFLTKFPSSCHNEIFRSDYQWLKWCPCKRSRS